MNSILHNSFNWSDGLVTAIPFRPDTNTLIVGDGDLSFSLALSRLLSNNARMICTVYDTQEMLYKKYPTAEANVRALEQCPNVHKVLYGIDAGSLHKAISNEAFDAIVFNFPHTGSGIKDRARNIRGNQLLLSRFFSSCHALLSRSPATGERVKLRATRTSKAIDHSTNIEPVNGRQECAIHVSMWMGDPYDDWRAKQLAKANGFRCAASWPFCVSDYPGYAHCRTHSGNEEEFSGRPARALMFTLGDGQTKAAKAQSDSE